MKKRLFHPISKTAFRRASALVAASLLAAAVPVSGQAPAIQASEAMELTATFNAAMQAFNAGNWAAAAQGLEQVIAKVLQSGYSLVSKLEADDGRWEGEGIKNGKKMDFHADPKTGVIIFEKLDD